MASTEKARLPASAEKRKGAVEVERRALNEKEHFFTAGVAGMHSMNILYYCMHTYNLFDI